MNKLNCKHAAAGLEMQAHGVMQTKYPGHAPGIDRSEREYLAESVGKFLK